VPIPVILSIPDPLLASLLKSATDLKQDLHAYVLDALGRHAVLPVEESVAAGELSPDALAVQLYEAIGEMRHAATLGQAWKHRFGGGWKELDRGVRVKVGLRFKELVEDIAKGVKLPPVDGVRLARFGETSQDQALYADVRSLAPEFQ
jgi:hypothetical protein